MNISLVAKYMNFFALRNSWFLTFLNKFSQKLLGCYIAVDKDDCASRIFFTIVFTHAYVVTLDCRFQLVEKDCETRWI